MWTRYRVSGSITSVGGISQADDCLVLLVRSAEKLGESRRLTNENKQNAGGERIECSCMTYATLLQNAARTRDYVMRSYVGRFIDNQQSIHGGNSRSGVFRFPPNPIKLGAQCLTNFAAKHSNAPSSFWRRNLAL